MRRVIFGMFLLAVTYTNAQNWYVKAGGGYSDEFSKSEFNNTDPNGITGIEQSTSIRVSADGSTTTVESLNGTAGAGYKFFVAGGYMFNDYIGAEMGLNYFRGNRTLVGEVITPSIISSSNVEIQGFDLNPAIYLTPNFAKWNPYVRAGLLLTVGGDLTIDTNVLQIDGGGDGTDIMVNAESEVKSHFSVGYSGAVGVTYPINDKWELFSELEFKSFTIKSKSAEIKSYVTRAITGDQSQLVPGQQLEDLPRAEKEFIFSDSFTIDNATGENEDEPRNIPTQYVNASGIGLNLGVRYNF